MSTAFEKELAREVNELSSAIALNHVTSLSGYQEKRNQDDLRVANAIDAIKQAVDKYVIGADEEAPKEVILQFARRAGMTTFLKQVRNHTRSKQRQSLWGPKV